MATFIFGVFLSAFILLSVVGEDRNLLVFKGSFQSYFKKTVDSKQTYGLILYDDQQNTLAIHYDDDEKYGNIVRKVVILNYTSEEVLKIKGNKCTVEEPIKEDSDFFPFPSTNKNDRSKMELTDILLFDSNDCKQIADEVSMCVSKKKLTEDGVNSQTCNLQHWFTGTKLDADGEYWTLQKINITCGDIYQAFFEFYHFQNQITAPEELQQPLGIFCLGKKSSKAAPSLPDRFRLTLEAIATAKNVVLIKSTEVWYDTESEIILEDNRVNWNKRDALFVYEYKRGVIYDIDSLGKRCKIAPMDEKKQKMKPKESYFWLQNTQYIGKKSSDGIAYDVWATSPPNNSVVRNVFYMELLSRSLEDKGNVNVPVKMAEYAYDGKDLQSYTYTRVLHYEFYPIDWSIFDMTLCFDSNNQGIPFELTVEGPALPLNAIPPFQDSVHLELLYCANVAATRISNFQIHHMPTDEDGSAVITGIITEDPAILGVGKDLMEGSAEESYQKLFRRVRHKEFNISVKAGAHSEKLNYSATRINRLPRRGYITPTPLVEPEIPPSFQTEFTMYFFSSIYHGSLLYDDSLSTLSIHFREESKRNFYIYNFDTKEELIITGWNCEAKSVDSGVISIFPFAVKNLHHEDKGGPKSKFVLLFDGDNKQFVGEEIDAFQRKLQKWSSTKEITIDEKPMNCDLTHWFVVDDNSTSLEKINLNCVFPEKKDENGVEILIHLSQFAYAVKNQEELQTLPLQQPAGIYCKNKLSTLTPPLLPDRFRIGGDTLFGHNGVAISSSFELWYDTESQLLRSDEKTSFNSLHTVTISEFKRGLRYYIKVNYDECQIQNLTGTGKQMPSKSELLKFGSEDLGQKPQFAGQRIINGIPHDVWTYASEDFNHVAEILYVKEVETISEQAVIPVKVDVFDHQAKQHVSYRLYNYDLNPSDWSVFDLAHCFDADQKIQFQLAIKGSRAATFPSMPTFTEEVHQQLLKHLQVSATRVSNFQIFYLGEGAVMVSGVLTEDPVHLGFGSGSSEASAEQALQNLLGSVQNDAFSFKIMPTGEEEEIIFTGKTVERLNVSDSKPVSPGYSSGSMAVLGLCMLIIGGLLGGAVFMIYTKFKQTAGFQRHTNDGL